MKTELFKRKYFVAAAISVCFCMITRANVPQGLNYQAVARNNAGSVLSNQHINLRFTIRRDNLTGGIQYSEIDSVTTNQQGIFTVVIGGGTNVAGNFDTIPWAATSFFLQVEMDITGGSNFIDMGTSQLVSVPYALYAKSAGAIDLAPTVYPTITGNDTIVVSASGYIIVTSTVTPSAAQVTLTPGVYAGQILCIAGASTGSSGIRFINGGLLNLGTGGQNDIQNGSMMMFMWSGTKWLKIAYSPNQ